MISLTDDRKMLGYALLGAYPNISHFVTTRHGGYSEGAYASFNCSPFSGDELERVEKNQTLLFQSLSQAPRHLIIPFQTHGTKILPVDEKFLGASGQQQQEMLNGSLCPGCPTRAALAMQIMSCTAMMAVRWL